MLESKKRSRVDFEYTHRVVWMKQEGKETLPWAIEQWCMINDLPLWGAACIYCCMDCEVIISISVHVGVSIKELWKVSGMSAMRSNHVSSLHAATAKNVPQVPHLTSRKHGLTTQDTPGGHRGVPSSWYYVKSARWGERIGHNRWAMLDI